MTNYAFVARFVLFLIAFGEGQAMGQQKSIPSFYFEVHAIIQDGFGPSETQAEITGDYHEFTFDNKKHYNPGFKTAYAPEIVAGYHIKEFQFQSSLAFFKQDIGLMESLNNYNQYQFVLANMLSCKATAMMHLSNPEKRGPYGWYGGIAVSTIFPISYSLNDQTKTYFSINDFQPAAQLCWSMDQCYILRLGRKGLYLTGGLSVPIPGLGGCIGKIKMEPDSPYTLGREKVKMYSISANLGFGFRLKN